MDLVQTTQMGGPLYLLDPKEVCDIVLDHFLVNVVTMSFKGQGTPGDKRKYLALQCLELARSVWLPSRHGPALRLASCCTSRVRVMYQALVPEPQG